MSLPLTGIMCTIININYFFYFSNMLCSSHYAKITGANNVTHIVFFFLIKTFIGQDGGAGRP